MQRHSYLWMTQEARQNRIEMNNLSFSFSFFVCLVAIIVPYQANSFDIVETSRNRPLQSDKNAGWKAPIQPSIIKFSTSYYNSGLKGWSGRNWFRNSEPEWSWYIWQMELIESNFLRSSAVLLGYISARGRSLVSEENRRSFIRRAGLELNQDMKHIHGS